MQNWEESRTQLMPEVLTATFEYSKCLYQISFGHMQILSQCIPPQFSITFLLRHSLTWAPRSATSRTREYPSSSPLGGRTRTNN
ncbi:hypothetical protein DPMN_005094 [Dreissena polymorpha]|uniref:Uncharacterized protein n=1 Tax=Dreissena polymorpha TaxID=45954 RepID=A0A9D4MSU9_DREPO|nr:hypothetical protein DPMN_005094 [Dreissena polymorpha]